MVHNYNNLLIICILIVFNLFELVLCDFEHNDDTFINRNLNHNDYDVICLNSNDHNYYLLYNGYISINASKSNYQTIATDININIEMNLMDIQLLSKNPSYYVFIKYIYQYLLDKISINNINTRSQWGQFVNWISNYINTIPACMDGNGYVIAEQSLLNSLPVPMIGEKAEWCSLSPPCSDLIQYSVYGDRCVIKINPNHQYCIQIPKSMTISNKTHSIDDKMSANGIQYEAKTPLLASNWLWHSIYNTLDISDMNNMNDMNGGKQSPIDITILYWDTLLVEVNSLYNSYIKNTISVSSVMNSGVIIMGIGVNFCSELPGLIISIVVWSLKCIPFVDSISHILLYCINTLPSYIVYIILGLHIFNNAEDVYSESIMLQFVLMSTCGIFLSALTFLFLMYSLVKTMLVLPKNIPFLSSILSIGILIPAAMLSNSTWFYLIKKVLMVYMIDFWNYGVFGIDWLGKLYIFIYITGSIICTKYFKLFEDDSYSKWILVYFIKSCGIYMIIYIFMNNDYYYNDIYIQCSNTSTYNIEILIILLLGIFIHDWCRYNLPSWYVTIMGLYIQTPTYTYSGRKLLSKGEYESEGRYYTEKALKDLQQTLQKDLPYANKLSDKLYKDGKYLQSNMLKRFAHGDYMGIPYDRVIHRNRNNFSYSKLLIGIVCIICILYVYKFYI